MTSLPPIEAPLVIGAQLDARASHPEIGHRVALRAGDQVWTYRQLRDEAVRIAHFLRQCLSPIDDARPGYVAMLMENRPELISLYAG